MDTKMEAAREPRDDALVPIRAHLPELPQFLPYSTADNFTGQRIYPFDSAFLRFGTVKKLAVVLHDLQALGLGLLLWDGFRPLSAQRKLWQVCPDTTYVADPDKDSSPHCRGNAVDVTLTDLSGCLLEMPSEFDDFSPRADRTYALCSPAAAKNARLLEAVMLRHGFRGYENEWWHFNDMDTYPIESGFEPIPPMSGILIAAAPLLPAPGDTSIARLDAGKPVSILAENGGLLYIRCRGLYGYVSPVCVRQNIP